MANRNPTVTPPKTALNIGPVTAVPQVKSEKPEIETKLSKFKDSPWYHEDITMNEVILQLKLEGVNNLIESFSQKEEDDYKNEMILLTAVNIQKSLFRELIALKSKK